MYYESKTQYASHNIIMLSCELTTVVINLTQKDVYHIQNKLPLSLFLLAKERLIHRFFLQKEVGGYFVISEFVVLLLWLYVKPSHR